MADTFTEKLYQLGYEVGFAIASKDVRIKYINNLLQDERAYSSYEIARLMDVSVFFVKAIEDYLKQKAKRDARRKKT